MHSFSGQRPNLSYDQFILNGSRCFPYTFPRISKLLYLIILKLTMIQIHFRTKVRTISFCYNPLFLYKVISFVLSCFSIYCKSTVVRQESCGWRNLFAYPTQSHVSVSYLYSCRLKPSLSLCNDLNN